MDQTYSKKRFAWATPKMRKNIFTEIYKSDYIIFFSILCDVFCQKGSFPANTGVHGWHLATVKSLLVSTPIKHITSYKVHIPTLDMYLDIFNYKSVKYLGIKIDENLNLKQHINDIAIRLNRSTLREEILAGRKFGEFGDFGKNSPN